LFNPEPPPPRRRFLCAKELQMSRITALILSLLFGAVACESNRRPAPHHARVQAADLFTGRYADSAFARWNLRGHAAGADCDVLIVETSVVLEDAMVEALHYGAGAYDVYKGGIQQFSSDHAFHGVVYRDSTRKEWGYGETGPLLVPCS
jgi:hypothetical protein